MAIGGFDGSIRIDTKIDPGGFNSGISSMLAGVKKVAVALAAIFGAKLAAQAAAGIVKLAAEFQRLELAAAAVGRMFGYTQEQTRATVNELIDLGIQTDVANKAFINFAREGLDTSLLPALARGAQDLNVFAEAGATSSDVLNRLLYAVLTLQPEMFRTAGVAIDLGEANKKWAAAAGITVAQMTIQERRQAALIALTEKLTGVTGLYEISQRTLAGQLSSQIRIVNEFKAALGGPFTGAVFTVVKAWNDLLKAFTKAIGPGGQLRSVFINLAAAAQLLANAIARVIQFIGALFGVKIEIGAQAAGELADTTGELGGAAGEAADAQDDLADSTDAATKAAKGALAAFDELNVLQQAEPPAGGGGGGGGGGIEPIVIDPGPLTDALDEIGAAVDALKAKLTNIFGPVIESLGRLWVALQPLKDFTAQALIDFYEHFLKPVGDWVIGEGLPRFIDAITDGLGKIDWDRINAALVTLWDALAPFAINIGEGLLWLWENVLVPLGVWVVNDALPPFLELLAAGIETLNKFIKAAKPTLKWLWETFLKPLAEWAGDKIIEALGWLTEKLEALGDWIEENQWAVDILVIVLASLAAGFIIVGVAMGLMLIVGGALTAVFTFLSSPIVIVALVIGALIAVIILLYKNWDLIKAKAAEVWTLIKFIWEVAAAWFQVKVVDPIKAYFTDLWDRITEWTANAWASIQEKWAGAKAWFQETVIDPIKEAFETVLDWLKEKWETIFTGVGDFVKGVVNTIIDLINGMIAAVAGGLNAVIAGLNSLKITIPSWIPIYGGNTWSVDIPLIEAPVIPHLATGAVIPPNAAFLAMLGDQRSGRNIEAPEGLLRQIVREEMGKLEADIKIEFGGALGALVRELKPFIDKENVRIGGSLITAKGGA